MIPITHSFAKNANEWGTPRLSGPPAQLPIVVTVLWF